MNVKALAAIVGTLSLGALATGCASAKSAEGKQEASAEKGAEGSCGAKPTEAKGAEGSCGAKPEAAPAATPEKGAEGSCGAGSCGAKK